MRSAVDRYVEGLLRRRRPRPFAPSEDDLAVARTAIALAAAGPDRLEPDQEFVARLRRRLAREAGRGAAGTVEGPARAPEPARPSRAVPARRRLLQATALTAGAAVVGAAADHLVAGRPAAPGRPADAQGELKPFTGTWQTVAADADLREGDVLEFDAGNVTGFVRRASGRVQAVSGICTHQGCRLDLASPPDQLVCPCHGATFSVSGQPLAYPAAPDFPMQPLPRLAVRVQDGDIQVYAVAPKSTPAPAQANGPDAADGPGPATY
jgi:cytochrome b6-f complex iron-sulfur subunit